MQQQLRDIRQLVTNFGSRAKAIHEARFEDILEKRSPPAIVIDPLQLVIPPTFHAEVQKYQLSSRSREILSRALDGMLADYTKQFDDSCCKLSQTTTVQLQPLLPSIIEKLRNGMQTYFETQGLPKIMAEVVEYAEKRLPHSTSQLPLPPTRPKPFNKVRTSPFISPI